MSRVLVLLCCLYLMMYVGCQKGPNTTGFPCQDKSDCYQQDCVTAGTGKVCGEPIVSSGEPNEPAATPEDAGAPEPDKSLPPDTNEPNQPDEAKPSDEPSVPEQEAVPESCLDVQTDWPSPPENPPEPPSDQEPCTDGATKTCYTGPPGSLDGNDICKTGTSKCEGGKWGECVNEVTPKPPKCNETKDLDCNGTPDKDQCNCTN